MVDGLDVFDSTRNAHSNQNYVYDASGRMIEDKSKNLSIEYDAYGNPVCFTVEKDSRLIKKYNLYDPSGKKVSELLFENGVKKSRKTDLIVGGKKVVERHQNYEIASEPISENIMIYGKSSVIGRVHSDKNKEWYVKDYQGSVVMTSFDVGKGSVISYEPYGNQKQIVVDGDVPSEQYTGKEYDSYSGLYYFGSRYYDPMLGLWISPDPQNEFFNPYGRSNDPVNHTDHEGQCEIFCVITIVTAAIVGAYVGGTAANDGEINPTKWDWSSGRTWGYMGIGAVIGAASSYVGVGVVGAGLASTLGSGALATGISSAVGTSVATALTYAGNEAAFGGVREGKGLFKPDWPEVGRAALRGAVLGFFVGAIPGAASVGADKIAQLGGTATTLAPILNGTAMVVQSAGYVAEAMMFQYDWIPIAKGLNYLLGIEWFGVKSIGSLSVNHTYDGEESEIKKRKEEKEEDPFEDLKNSGFHDGDEHEQKYENDDEEFYQPGIGLRGVEKYKEDEGDEFL